MADIFVSYKKEDFQIAEIVVQALREDGFSVWWDEGLTPRMAWDVALEQEISQSAAVIVLWTARSANSEWVRTEAHYAQDRGKLVPVTMEECTVPIAFMLKQRINLVGWNGERNNRQWRKLLTWIADLVSIKPGNANIPQAPGAAHPNPFREVVGYMASGEPIVDGALINVFTPALTAFHEGSHMPVMRILPKGGFTIGSAVADPDRSFAEGPQKRIEIPAPFAIGVFPVTFQQYRAVVGRLPSIEVAPAPSKGLFGLFKRQSNPIKPAAPIDPLLPATQVSFEDAQEFVSRVTSTSGATYRLPSEAEWEYACRAGSRTRYSFGDSIDSKMALFASNGGPMPPGSFPSNAFGLHDMHGNVREWTVDMWHESYDVTPLDGSPLLEGHGNMRVVRGGCWSDGPSVLRSAARMRASQSTRTDTIGFRVVRVIE